MGRGWCLLFAFCNYAVSSFTTQLLSFCLSVSSVCVRVCVCVCVCVFVCVRVRAQLGGITVDVNLTEHLAVVRFSDYHDGSAPFLLINHTRDHTIQYHQTRGTCVCV